MNDRSSENRVSFDLIELEQKGSLEESISKPSTITLSDNPIVLAANFLSKIEEGEFFETCADPQSVDIQRLKSTVNHHLDVLYEKTISDLTDRNSDSIIQVTRRFAFLRKRIELMIGYQYECLFVSQKLNFLKENTLTPDDIDNINALLKKIKPLMALNWFNKRCVFLIQDLIETISNLTKFCNITEAGSWQITALKEVTDESIFKFQWSDSELETLANLKDLITSIFDSDICTQENIDTLIYSKARINQIKTTNKWLEKAEISFLDSLIDEIDKFLQDGVEEKTYSDGDMIILNQIEDLLREILKQYGSFTFKMYKRLKGFYETLVEMTDNSLWLADHDVSDLNNLKQHFQILLQKINWVRSPFKLEDIYHLEKQKLIIAENYISTFENESVVVPNRELPMVKIRIASCFTALEDYRLLQIRSLECSDDAKASQKNDIIIELAQRKEKLLSSLEERAEVFDCRILMKSIERGECGVTLSTLSGFQDRVHKAMDFLKKYQIAKLTERGEEIDVEKISGSFDIYIENMCQRLRIISENNSQINVQNIVSLFKRMHLHNLIELGRNATSTDILNILDQLDSFIFNQQRKIIRNANKYVDWFYLQIQFFALKHALLDNIKGFCEEHGFILPVTRFQIEEVRPFILLELPNRLKTSSPTLHSEQLPDYIDAIRYCADISDRFPDNINIGDECDKLISQLKLHVKT